jgi:hypothetical protein
MVARVAGRLFADLLGNRKVFENWKILRFLVPRPAWLPVRLGTVRQHFHTQLD